MAGPLIVTAELAPKTLPGSTTCAAGTFRPSATAAGAPHDVPCDRSVGGGRASSDPATVSEESPPHAWIAGLMNLGGGVAFRIVSDDLDAIRGEIADAFAGCLPPRISGLAAHVTIQNKVPPREAKALFQALGNGFAARPIRISGLGLHRYLGGPWETLRTFPFRG